MTPTLDTTNTWDTSWSAYPTQSDARQATQSIRQRMEAANGYHPTVQQEQESVKEQKPGRTLTLPWRKIKIMCIAVLAITLAVAASIPTINGIKTMQHNNAYTTCKDTVAATLKTKQSLKTQVTRASNTVTINPSQVKDAQTIAGLRAAIKEMSTKPTTTLSCTPTMSTKDLQATTSQANRLSGEYQKTNQRISTASKAVLASRDAKSLDDVKAGLVAKKSEAEKLLADSDGRVADGAVRDGLQNALNQANQVSGSRVKDYQDATNTLQAAMDQVNASIQQKTQADQQAAQAAPQEVTPPQETPQPQFNRVNRGQPTTPSTPTPVTPAPQHEWSVPPVTNGDNATFPDHL